MNVAISCDLTLGMLTNFLCSFSLSEFFENSTFAKNSFRNTIRVSNSLDPDVVSGLIWAQTVYIDYHKTTLVGKALNDKGINCSAVLYKT